MDKSIITDKTIGILALQGDYEAHRLVLESLRVRTVQVKSPADLARADALILPGGESTTIAKLLKRIGLEAPIRERVRAGMPVYGTCAGMILMSREITDRPEQPTLNLIDMTVTRNAFGRQVDSFEAEVLLTSGGEEHVVLGVFIRSPYVSRIGDAIKVLAMFEERIVAVRQGSLLATAFHPELTHNEYVHKLFAHMVDES